MEVGGSARRDSEPAGWLVGRNVGVRGCWSMRILLENRRGSRWCVGVELTGYWKNLEISVDAVLAVWDLWRSKLDLVSDGFRPSLLRLREFHIRLYVKRFPFPYSPLLPSSIISPPSRSLRLHRHHQAPTLQNPPPPPSPAAQTRPCSSHM